MEFGQNQKYWQTDTNTHTLTAIGPTHINSCAYTEWINKWKHNHFQNDCCFCCLSIYFIYFFGRGWIKPVGHWKALNNNKQQNNNNNNILWILYQHFYTYNHSQTHTHGYYHTYLQSCRCSNSITSCIWWLRSVWHDAQWQIRFVCLHKYGSIYVCVCLTMRLSEEECHHNNFWMCLF